MISTGSPFEAQVGYSRAVVQGDWCFVSGITGYDYATMDIPKDIAAQARNCFATLKGVLDEAGFAHAGIVRVTHIVRDRALIDPLLPVLASALGDVRPAATMIVAELMEPEMLYELEVTAFRGG
nr:RidA family protein [Jannaschia sp. S6380]